MATVSTPLWTNPPISGQLSNQHGANTGADAISLTAKYKGPGGPSGMRITGARTAMNNQPLGSPQQAWEAAWVGQPATSPLPANMSLGCQAAINYFGRVYVVVPPAYAPFNYCIGGIMSAEVQGGNVGSWRWENPVRVVYYNPFNDPQYVSDTVNPGAICYVGNWLYVLGQTGVYYSYVLPDGRLTNWVLGLSTNSGPGSTMTGWQNVIGAASSGGWMGQVVILYNNGGGVTPLLSWNVAQDGSIEQITSVNTSVPVGRGYCAMHIDPYGGTFIIGGEDNAGVAQSDVRFAFIDYVTHNVPGWGTSLALPAARSRYGFAWQSGRTTNDTDVFVCGGQAGTGGAGTAVSTVYTTLGTNLHNGVGSWTSFSGSPGLTATKACATALSRWGGANKPTTTQQAAPPGWPYPIYPDRFDATASATVPQPSIIVLGGAATTAVQVSDSWVWSRPWFSGPAPVFSGTPFGTGSQVVPNSDGSYSLTFNYADASQGGFGLPKALGTLLDGDQITIGVQFASSATGDVSAAGTTLIRIGQPPTVTVVAPLNAATPNNGNPPISFTYNQGAGGAAQATARVRVTQGGGTIYDSGVRQGAFNSVAAMPIAPLLLPSTLYSLIIDVTSLDTPMTGSSDSGTSTTAFTPTAFTRLGAPGSFTATPDNVNARIALAWAAVGSATGYNIYYRRNAVGGTFYLLASVGAVTSFTAMDRLAVGVGYDFQVTTLSAVPAESVPSTTVSNVSIAPGSWSAYLHVAGNGTTYGIPLQVQGSPAIAKKRGALQQSGFGQGAPIARYGTSDYHTIAAKALLLDATPVTLKSLQAIIDQIEAGGTAWWRDALGGMMLVTFDTDQAIAVKPPWNREVDLKMTETNDIAAPIVMAGTAQGYQATVNGNRPPLDLSERLL